jgi:hypothetical protein
VAGAGFSAQSIYGMSPQAPNYGVAPPTQQMATDGIATGIKGLFDPSNPLLWFGVLAGVTLLAGAGASFRLGPARASASVGA